MSVAAGAQVGTDEVLVGKTERPVRFCARCGAELNQRAFVQEYWTAKVRMFHCWCDECGFVCDVTPTDRVVTHEPEHD